ncbi:conserved Plasmodium protein, unknown function [Plasmodium gallinaceum]|uniref:BTB domain-containing protein n=1 Tax=Plasmodium gallinaceum TaxID=5849 RepID=A0A1J1GU07_PLAGA|nr:conserved Plasmodium protein, unknown function [Plasmodium gallinaceum]CRG94798.1 conserved Plasmodium protein, unknown function [Plasmodium gallinaceum]
MLISEDNIIKSSDYISSFETNKEKLALFRNKNLSRRVFVWNKLKFLPNNNEQNFQKYNINNETNLQNYISDKNTSYSCDNDNKCVRFPRRSGAASVLYKNYIYIFGGYKSKKRLNDFYKYNIIENKWIKIIEENCPSARENNPSFLYKGKMYIIGGYQGNKNWLNDFYSFNLNIEKWEIVDVNEKSKVNAPSSLFGFALSIDESKGVLYLFGGFDGLRLHNKMYAYNIEKKKWIYVNESGDIPSPRSCSVGHICDGYFYLFGGFSGENALNCLYEYHLKTGIWTKMKYNMNKETLRNSKLIYNNEKKGCSHNKNNYCDIPIPRYFSGSFLHNKCIYILGGYNEYSGRLNDFYKFDIHQRIWTQINTTNNFSGRSNMNLHLYKNVIYCIAGFDGENFLNDVYALKLENVYVQPSSLLSSYKFMVNNPRYADVIFILQNRYIYGCKSILSARCPSFNSIFDLHFTKETTGISHNIMPIPINDIPYDIFLIVINYLYTDELSLNYSLETYTKILVTAGNFNIFRLLQLCELIISNHINEINVLDIVLLSYKYNCKQLCKFCLDFIINNKLLDDNKINRLIIEPYLLGEIYKRSLCN